MNDKITAYSLAMLIVLIATIIVTYPVMFLWNECLVPAVDGVHEVTFLQMFGLMILFTALFKGQGK